MKEKLEKLLENSYAPYSNFKVSCIIKTNDNQEFLGVNVENASYGATICAERNALLNAITNGFKKGDFKEIHIMNSSSKIAFPCFMCRQVLIEFLNPDTKVYLYTKDKMEEYSLEELTPHVFNEENL
ncbi:MAG: cytidine deaminase [Bacilli bacterium]|nr:cytidine deaminase [Bacilli bacterium]